MISPNVLSKLLAVTALDTSLDTSVGFYKCKKSLIWLFKFVGPLLFFST